MLSKFICMDFVVKHLLIFLNETDRDHSIGPAIDSIFDVLFLFPYRSLNPYLLYRVSYKG
jgi:hypothetical protein